jgi:hypothetical protein
MDTNIPAVGGYRTQSEDYMARRPALSFAAFLEHAADLIAERIASSLPRNGARGTSDSANAKRRRAMLGRKLDMSCRVAGCKNRSGGPRHGFMCEDHQKLPKKQQAAAREAWKARHAA